MENKVRLSQKDCKWQWLYLIVIFFYFSSIISYITVKAFGYLVVCREPIFQWHLSLEYQGKPYRALFLSISASLHVLLEAASKRSLLHTYNHKRQPTQASIFPHMFINKLCASVYFLADSGSHRWRVLLSSVTCATVATHCSVLQPPSLFWNFARKGCSLYHSPHPVEHSCDFWWHSGRQING